jgi:hypothetical protein
VTREGKWPLAAAVAVVLATMLLAACGGSDSDSSGTTAATTGSTTTAGESVGQQDQGSQNQGGSQGQAEDQNGGQRQGSSQGQRAQQAGGGHPRNVATPLKVSGGGAAQFRTNGGDNSIQDYGEEEESELQEVAEIVHGFYVARAEERWDAACSYLSKSNIGQLEKLVAQAPEIESGCAPALRAFTQPLPPAIEREVTTVDAGSFRREGEQGFLIYYGAEHIVYAMPLIEEGGAWKVTSLSGTTLS